jgi:BirA family biotin operon repressor/biotin-[acetyl-CoA-carboxylase] ligase
MMNFTILRFDTLDSTNTEAANQARTGVDEGLCVIADEQTAGRGRQGRSWESTKGAGLFFSIVLRPTLAPRELPLITLMAAAAVYDILLKAFLIRPDIKWPNDILVGERKICGILAEAVETSRGLAVILGIGINLKTEAPIENATSIEIESTFPADRDEIVDVLTEHLTIGYERLLSDPSAIIEDWKQRSSYFQGKAVQVTLGPNSVLSGVTDGLEANGALRIKRADGSVGIVQAGDVERLRSDDPRPAGVELSGGSV